MTSPRPADEVSGDLLIAQADITQLAADAVVYSTDPRLGGNGQLYSAFCARFPGFAARLRELQRSTQDRKTGDAFWMPLDTRTPPYGVVAVVSTGGGTENGAPLAVSNAVRCAHRELLKLGGEGRRLVALPAIRLGYGGDRRTPLKSARLQLAAARAALDECPGLDAAFIPYTPDHHQIYLEARRRLREKEPERWPTPTDMEVPAELVDAVRRGECVLFVGSGLSSEAGLPGWDELVTRLASALGVVPEPRRDTEYYLDLAQWYRESPLEQEKPLAEIVRETFAAAGDVRPTLAHYLLMGLPVQYVVTTNYDDLLEVALRALRRYPLVVVEQSEVAGTGRRDGVHVVKLHGDARRGKGFVLSRDDYEAFFQDRPALASLLEGLLLNQTFLFTGYSLRDPDFRQIHHRVSAMLSEAKRPAFATTFDLESPYVRRQWAAKRVELLFVPGEGSTCQARQLVRFLERLSEEVAGRQRLFLAPDVHPEASEHRPMGILRTALKEAGEQVKNLLTGDRRRLSPEEVEQLEWSLRFLTRHGWRPDRGVSLSGLWQRLASCSRTPEERQRRLVMALPHTETLRQAERILEELDALHAGLPGPAQKTRKTGRRNPGPPPASEESSPP